MEKSTSIVNIAKALLQFHRGIDKIPKDATNPFFNSRYCTLSKILETIKQPLLDAGLSFVQFPTGNNGLTTTLMHGESGEYMQADYFMQPIKNDPQAQGSVISYMRRYSLAAVLGLNIDDDDDANSATHGAASPKDATTQAKRFTEQDNKPWLNPNTPEYDNVVECLKAKTMNLQDAAMQFKINKNVRAELQEVIDSLTPGYQEAQQAQAAVNADKPWLDKNSKKWDLITERLKNKTTTLSQVAQYFKLNKEVRAELQGIINEVQ